MGNHAPFFISPENHSIWLTNSKITPIAALKGSNMEFIPEGALPQKAQESSPILLTFATIGRPGNQAHFAKRLMQDAEVVEFHD